jgi:hypothetical protein
VSVLTACQSAALRLIGRKPTTFFGSSGTFENELCDLVNEVARDAFEYRDWQVMVRTHTITGDGSADAFDLPTDYDRMMVNSEVQDGPAWLFGYTHVMDMNQFLFLRDRGFVVPPGVWIIFADQMNFAPAPPNGQTAMFPYISRNWARPASGSDKAAFDTDTDMFLLPESLLTLGLVWRWRQNKKLDFTDDDTAYANALSFHGAKDGGSSVIRQRRMVFGRVPVAWPGVLG